MLLQKRRDCFCAFCKNPRRVYETKFLNVSSIISLTGFSLLLTYIIWGHFDLRGGVIFLLLLLIGELFSQVRWRQSMICTNCGFDLIVYLKNPEKAGEKIKDFIQYRSERPEYLLRPKLQLPKVPKNNAPPNKKLTPNEQKSKISLQG